MVPKDCNMSSLAAKAPVLGFLFVFVVVIVFETGSYNIDHADLELMEIYLSLPLECWN